MTNDGIRELFEIALRSFNEKVYGEKDTQKTCFRNSVGDVIRFRSTHQLNPNTFLNLFPVEFKFELGCQGTIINLNSDFNNIAQFLEIYVSNILIPIYNDPRNTKFVHNFAGQEIKFITELTNLFIKKIQAVQTTQNPNFSKIERGYLSLIDLLHKIVDEGIPECINSLY